MQIERFKLTNAKVSELNAEYGVKLGKLYANYVPEHHLFDACLGIVTTPSVRLVYSYSKLVDIMVAFASARYTEVTAAEELDEYIQVGFFEGNNPNWVMILDDRGPALPAPEPVKPAPPDAPAGYYLVTEGIAIKGDKICWHENDWGIVDGLHGSDVSTLVGWVYRKLPEPKQPKPVVPETPKGYERVTKGRARKGDKVYFGSSKIWDVVRGLVGDSIKGMSDKTFIYREIENPIPRGWVKVTCGKIKAGDQFLGSNGKWVKALNMVGHPVSEVTTIRRKANKPSWPKFVPKTAIPTGWRRITKGIAEKTDKMLYTDGTWHHISGCKGDRISNGWVVIRKKTKRVIKTDPEQEWTLKDGTVLVSKAHTSCDGCYLRNDYERCDSKHVGGNFCSAGERKDNTSSIWVKK